MEQKKLELMKERFKRNKQKMEAHRPKVELI